MSRERTPKPIRRRAGEVVLVGGAGVGAVLLLSEDVGAQEVGRTPVAVDQLQETQRQLFDACRFLPADLYTAPGATRTDEVGSGGDTDGAPDALYAVTTPKPDQGLLAFSRSCLGVTIDTPDPEGAVLATVGALTKQITTDSGIEDPNAVTTETQLTVNMSLIADMRRHLGTSPQPEPPPQPANPQTNTPESLQPVTPQPANPQLENSQTTTVAPNEGLLAVARRLGIDPAALAATNGYTLTADYRIVDTSGNRVTLDVGQSLIIPTPAQANNPQPENSQTSKLENSPTPQPETQPIDGPQAAWKDILTELAAEEQDPQYKALLEQAGVYQIDGRAVTYEDIQQIEAERGPDSLSVVFSTAPPQPGTDEEIRIQIDPTKEDVMAASVLEKCNQDLKWGLTCLLGPNAVPVAVWYVYAHRGGGGQPPAIVQYLSEKVAGKRQNRANEAEAYEAQLEAIAQELAGEGAGVVNYGGRPVLVDAAGNLAITPDGALVSVAPDYKTHATVAVDESDEELVAAINRYDVIHFVQPNETTLTGIIRNQMQSLLAAHELRLNPTQVNHLINLWTAAVLADRGGDDTVITGREIFIRSAGSVPELAEELVRLQAELNGTGPTAPNTLNNTNMNEGGSVGPETGIQFDDLRRIFKGEIIAEHLLLTQPEHARALFDALAGSTPTAEELKTIFRRDLMNQIETGMLALGERGATEAEYLAFIQSLTSTNTPQELSTITSALHIDYKPQPLDYVPDITKRGTDDHFDTFVSSYEIAELLAIAREFTHNKDFLEEHQAEFQRLYPSLWPQVMQDMELSATEADRVASNIMREDLWEGLKTDAYLRGLVDTQSMRVLSYQEQLDFLRNFRALLGEEGYQLALNQVLHFFAQQDTPDRATLMTGDRQLDAMIVSVITRLAHDPSIVLPTEDPSYHDNLRPIQDHYVQPRDTLYSLAKKYDTTVEDLMALNGLGSDQIAVHTYLIVPQNDSIYTKNSGGMMSENMGPGGGPELPPNNRYEQIVAQMTDTAALTATRVMPQAAQEFILAQEPSLTVDELERLLIEQYTAAIMQEVATRHAAGQTREQLLAYLATMTTADIAPFETFLANNLQMIPLSQQAADDLAHVLGDSLPEYERVRSTAYGSRDILARLAPEVFIENDLSGELSEAELLRISFMIVRDELAEYVDATQSAEPISEDAQRIYSMLAEMIGQDALNALIQTAGTPGTNDHAASILTHAHNRSGGQQAPAPETSPATRTAEQISNTLRQVTDPVALTLISINPELARQTIAALPPEAGMAQINLAMQQAYAQQFSRGIVDLVLNQADDDAWLMFYADQTTADNVDAFARELLDRTTTATEQEYYMQVMYYLTVVVPQYQEQYQDDVEDNAEVLLRFYPGLYQEHINQGYNTDEALRLQFEAVASGILSGIEESYGTNPNLVVTEYDREAMDWAQDVLGYDAWNKWILQHSIDTGVPDAATMSPLVLELLRQSLIVNRDVNIGDTLGHSEADTGRYIPEDDPNSMNRTDDAGAGSGMAGEGNGVDVQAGDTMTTPIAEADKRGDNAIDTPPSSWTNPSDYNPDGTPITPPGAEAMGEPMVTPDMAGSVASENQGMTAEQVAAMAIADAPNMGTGTVGETAGAVGGGGGGQKPKEAPLTNEEIYRILEEEAVAIEAHIRAHNDKFGPDPMAQMADLNNYITEHPEEIRRIMEREWKKMHPEEEWDTRWVWEDIDPAVKDAVVMTLLVTAAAAAAVGNTLSGSGA